jgi:hypothetical protein
VLTFAPILQVGPSPLNDAVRHLLDICQEEFHGAVEIEFAVTLDDGRARVGFLQVRPLSVSASPVTMTDDDITRPDVLVASNHVLGNGIDSTMTDVVYVKLGPFDMAALAPLRPSCGSESPLIDEGHTTSHRIRRWHHRRVAEFPWWSDIGGAGAIVKRVPAQRDAWSRASHTSCTTFRFSCELFLRGRRRPPHSVGPPCCHASGRRDSFVRHEIPAAVDGEVDGRSGRGVILEYRGRPGLMSADNPVDRSSRRCASARRTEQFYGSRDHQSTERLAR